ncbi:MAG: DegT/DnrJ/EryC1/StrS family aminotransferase [Candidatus Nitrospinota bacterium M3_3B_026]
MKIPFTDIKAQFARVEKNVRERVDRVFEHGRFILGPEVFELEEKLADYAGVKRAVACSSGTDALLLPLMAIGAGPGDAVFCPVFTFIATAEAAALTGATPVFVDIDPDTFNIDPGKLAEAVDRVKREGKLAPRAVIPVDLFGLPADYDAIAQVARETGLFVLADAAQSFGGVYKGKRAGSLGDAAATSFFPAKPLGCYGDGGAVFTDDDKLADRLVSIRVHGQGENKYDNVRLGLNARLDTIQAAVLLARLEVFDDEVEKRREVADRYTEALGDAVKTPSVPGGLKSAWAQYSVLSGRRDEMTDNLAREGIPTAIYYPKPLSLQKAFERLGRREGDFPVAEATSKNILSLPMSPYMAKETIDVIADAVRRAARAG